MLDNFKVQNRLKGNYPNTFLPKWKPSFLFVIQPQPHYSILWDFFLIWESLCPSLTVFTLALASPVRRDHIWIALSSTLNKKVPSEGLLAGWDAHDSGSGKSGSPAQLISTKTLTSSIYTSEVKWQNYQNVKLHFLPKGLSIQGWAFPFMFEAGSSCWTDGHGV